MIQLAYKTFWAEQRHVWSCGENISKTQFVALEKALNCLVASRVGCNGLQLCGCQDFAKDGKGPIGKASGMPGFTGQCAFAHSIHLLERPGEVWAAWRALFVL